MRYSVFGPYTAALTDYEVYVFKYGRPYVKLSSPYINIGAIFVEASREEDLIVFYQKPNVLVENYYLFNLTSYFLSYSEERFIVSEAREATALRQYGQEIAIAYRNKARLISPRGSREYSFSSRINDVFPYRGLYAAVGEEKYHYPDLVLYRDGRAKTRDGEIEAIDAARSRRGYAVLTENSVIINGEEIGFKASQESIAADEKLIYVFTPEEIYCFSREGRVIRVYDRRFFPLYEFAYDGDVYVLNKDGIFSSSGIFIPSSGSRMIGIAGIEDEIVGISYAGSYISTTRGDSYRANIRGSVKSFRSFGSVFAISDEEKTVVIDLARKRRFIYDASFDSLFVLPNGVVYGYSDNTYKLHEGEIEKVLDGPRIVGRNGEKEFFAKDYELLLDGKKRLAGYAIDVQVGHEGSVLETSAGYYYVSKEDVTKLSLSDLRVLYDPKLRSFLGYKAGKVIKISLEEVMNIALIKAFFNKLKASKPTIVKRYRPMTFIYVPSRDIIEYFRDVIPERFEEIKVFHNPGGLVLKNVRKKTIFIFGDLSELVLKNIELSLATRSKKESSGSEMLVLYFSDERREKMKFLIEEKYGRAAARKFEELLEEVSYEDFLRYFQSVLRAKEARLVGSLEEIVEIIKRFFLRYSSFHYGRDRICRKA